MPFLWTTVAGQGQIYGNRLYQNKMNVANMYKISYPGYNEMLTGYPDPIFHSECADSKSEYQYPRIPERQKRIQGKGRCLQLLEYFFAILKKKKSASLVAVVTNTLPDEDRRTMKSSMKCRTVS